MTWLLQATRLVAALVGLLAAPALLHAQRPLVYCPVGIDETGCSAIVNALGEADRGYDGSMGTVDLRTADLGAYTVLVIPSLADDGDARPYALLRDAVVGERLRGLLLGRQVFWSGTPDLGTASRADKDAFIQRLAGWAAGNHAVVNAPGLLVLQDRSADGSSRYAWVEGLTGQRITADPALNSYSSVRSLTAIGVEIVGGVAYANIASLGFYLPTGASGISMDAVGNTGTSTGGQVVLLTAPGANTDGAKVWTDKDDYAPGQMVTISGSGFEPGETIRIALHEDPMVHGDRTLMATADPSGNFINTAFAPEHHDIGVRFVLTATGMSSGRQAQTTFTDGTSLDFDHSPTSVLVSSTNSFSFTFKQKNGSSSGGHKDNLARVVIWSENGSFTGLSNVAISRDGTGTAWTVSLQTSGSVAGQTCTTSVPCIVGTSPHSVTPPVATVASSVNDLHVGETLTVQVTAAAPATSGDYQWKMKLASRDEVIQGGSGGGADRVVKVAGQKLVWSLAPSSAYTTDCVQLKIQRQNADGTPYAGGEQEFNLTQTSGTFYSNNTCGSNVSKRTIASGASETTFYYKSTTPGTFSLTASRDGYVSAVHQIQMTNPYRLVWSLAPASALGNTCVELKVRRQNLDGTPYAPGTGLTVNLGNNGGNFFNTLTNCNSSSGTIANGAIGSNQSETPSFYYRHSTGGTFTLFASATNYNQGVHQIQVLFSNSLVFKSELLTDPPASAQVNACVPLRVQRQDLNGNASNVSSNLTVSLGASIGSFYSNNNCTTSTTLQISAGQSATSTFYFKGTSEGTPRLTATAASHNPGTHDITISSTQPSTILDVAGSGTYGGTATLTARLTSGATNLADKTIAFTLNGNPIGTATTGSDGIASLTGVSLSGINAGTYANFIGASFAGATGFSGTDSQGNLTVGQAAPTFVFDLSTLAKTYGDAQFSVLTYVTENSTGNVTFATAPGSVGCTVTSAGVVTITGATGSSSCIIAALLAADANYTAAGPISQQFNIAKATPTFAGVTINNATYDGNPHGASASVTGINGTDLGSASVSYEPRTGSPGSYSYGATTTDAPTSAGDYRVRFAFAGTPDYNGISDITNILTIGHAPTTLVVSVDPGSVSYGGNVSLQATLKSGTANVAGKTIEFKIGNQIVGTATTTSPASLELNLSEVVPGIAASVTPYTVTASFAGDANYLPASDNSTLTINQASQNEVTISAPIIMTYGDAAETLTATGGDGTGAFVFSHGSSTGCSVTGDQLTVTNASGICEVTASRDGDDNYVASAPSAAAAVTLRKKQTTIDLETLIFTYNGSPQSTTASTQELGAAGITISYDGSTTPPTNHKAGGYAVVAILTDDNYEAVATGTLVIDRRDLTVSAVGQNREYDGTTVASVTLTTDKLGTDAVTPAYTNASFADKHVADGKEVNVSGISISGADAGNYALQNTTANTTANITERALTVTAAGVNREYDGTTAASVTLASNALHGDVVVAAYTLASFANRNVGEDKPVSVSGISISGTDALNYALASTTASTTADITQKDLTVTAEDETMDFGLTPPAFSVSYSGFVAGESESVQGVLTGSLAFGGIATTVTSTSAPGSYEIKPGGLTASNYAITFVPGVLKVNDSSKPVITNVTLSANPVPFNTTTSPTVSATISDVGTGGSNIVEWKYTIDGGTPIVLGVANPSSSVPVSAVLANKPVGVYRICVQGMDRDVLGNENWSDPVCILWAVYDPNGGFVTGGGWINSPAGAYMADAQLAGKAHFGFVAKYEKGSSTPTGKTEFQFQVADLNFKSTSYEWLVVNSTTQAQYKGVGTINGAGEYGFLITVLDGDNFAQKKPDSFRIKIWNRSTGQVVYDNQPTDEENSNAATLLGDNGYNGGSIVIHQAKK